MKSKEVGECLIEIENEMAEKFPGTYLSIGEWRELYGILDKACTQTKKSCIISYEQFEEMTGLKRRAIQRYLKQLIERKILFTKGSGKRIEYGINEDTSQWQFESKKRTIPKVGKGVENG